MSSRMNNGINVTGGNSSQQGQEDITSPVPLDENLSFEGEDFLKKQATTTMLNSHEITATDCIPSIYNPKSTVVSFETQKEPDVGTKFVKMDSMMDHDNGGKRKRQNEHSVEMLKVRALKTDRVKKNIQPLNGKLEALDDFDDDTFDTEGS